MKQLVNSIRYEIYADNCDGTVTVKNLEHSNYFVRPASQILNDAKLLAGFSKESISLLSSIAGVERV